MLYIAPYTATDTDGPNRGAAAIPVAVHCSFRGVCLRALVGVCMLVCLGACSSTTLVYNRLDFILPWYLERYVDLDREQGRQLDEQLEPLLAWHRREELPQYLELLDTMIADLDDDLDLALIGQRTDELEIAWYRVRDRGLDELLELGNALRDDQIDEFIESLNKKQRKYERKYLSRDDEEFREDAYDNLREFFEDYLGRLNAEQRQRVKDAVANLQRSDDRWLSERAEWIAVMTLELNRDPGWEDRVRYTIFNWESQLDADTLAVYEQNTQTVQMALVDVVNARTEKQDRRLRRKLQSLREDLVLLIGQIE